MRTEIVIAIGGTGARIMRALVHLWAVQNEEYPRALLPVLIDTDTECGSHDNFSALMSSYSVIQKLIPQNKDNERYFFKNQLNNYMRFNLKTLIGSEFGQTFKEYVDSLGGREFQEKTNENNYYSDFLSLLYSEKEKQTKINEGFFGNPKIGSMVFSSIDLQSSVFDGLGPQLQNASSITIVGSLHGGTGSTGMMPFLKALMNHPILKNERYKKNLVLVEPYYQVNNNENNDTIHHISFIPKAEAAKLQYLKEESIIKNLNSIYILSGDYTTKTYEYAETKQKNDAHWIELMAARSIISEIYNSNNQGQKKDIVFRLHTHHAENDDTNIIRFKNIKPDGRDRFWQDFAGFSLLMMYLKYEYLTKIPYGDSVTIVDTESLPLFVRNRLISNKKLIGGISGLLEYCKLFEIFLGELNRSNFRLFTPLEENSKDWSKFLVGQNPLQGEKVFLFNQPFNIDSLIDEFLRKIDNGVIQGHALFSVLNAGTCAMNKLFSREKIIVFHNN